MANFSPDHIVAADNCDFNPPTCRSKHEGSFSGVHESVVANFNCDERHCVACFKGGLTALASSPSWLCIQ